MQDEGERVNERTVSGRQRVSLVVNPRQVKGLRPLMPRRDHPEVSELSSLLTSSLIWQCFNAATRSIKLKCAKLIDHDLSWALLRLHSYFMYVALQHRYQEVIADCIDLLGEAMAPARTWVNDDRARTPIVSTASSPSLRSKTPVAVPMTPPPGNMTPGGNVKVVVRVRGFLQRGKIHDHQVGAGVLTSFRARPRCTMFDRDGSRHSDDNTVTSMLNRLCQCKDTKPQDCGGEGVHLRQFVLVS